MEAIHRLKTNKSQRDWSSIPGITFRDRQDLGDFWFSRIFDILKTQSCAISENLQRLWCLLGDRALDDNRSDTDGLIELNGRMNTSQQPKLSKS